MNNSSAPPNIFNSTLLFSPQIFGGVILILILQISLSAQSQFTVTQDEKTLIVDDAPEQEIVSFGKNVIVRKHAKTVLVFGGDALIEGVVDEEVAVIGGSVVQNSEAEIGGDVIVFGGNYRPESKTPLRGADKQTVVLGVFEDELREIMQNPSQIFAPSFSKAFLAQRVLSILFWFVISLGLTTLAPGAVSRAVARVQLSTLKIFAIGFSAFLVTTLTIIGSLRVLPNYVSATFGLMALVLLMLAYVFGRVALQVSLGKMLQKLIFGDRKQSETFAILIGVAVWTILLSIPYVWTLALLTLFAAGIGLVLTARTTHYRQKK